MIALIVVPGVISHAAVMMSMIIVRPQHALIATDPIIMMMKMRTIRMKKSRALAQGGVLPLLLRAVAVVAGMVIRKAMLKQVVIAMTMYPAVAVLQRAAPLEAKAIKRLLN